MRQHDQRACSGSSDDRCSCRGARCPSAPRSGEQVPPLTAQVTRASNPGGRTAIERPPRRAVVRRGLRRVAPAGWAAGSRLLNWLPSVCCTSCSADWQAAEGVRCRIDFKRAGSALTQDVGTPHTGQGKGRPRVLAKTRIISVVRHILDAQRREPSKEPLSQGSRHLACNVNDARHLPSPTMDSHSFDRSGMLRRRRWGCGPGDSRAVGRNTVGEFSSRMRGRAAGQAVRPMVTATGATGLTARTTGRLRMAWARRRRSAPRSSAR
ncbi:hypothetical protein SCANM124S_00197 [Streptomyces canus]